MSKVKICLKKYFLSVFFISLMIPLFAQSVSSEFSTAVENKDLDRIETLLLDASSGDSVVMENALLNEAKKAVLSNDYDYASALAELVLLKNLDNEQAQNMYVSIEELKRQKAAADEAKRRDEQVKLQKLAEEE